MTYEVRLDSFLISTDKARIDLAFVHDFLSNSSYWAKNIPLEVVKASIENSVCFGIYEEDQQVGFARVITDKATIAYLGDVFVAETYRGRGLSKWLMASILAHPELQGFRRWLLATADAHTLYAQFGFTPLARSARWLELHNPDVYPAP